ncbi:MAG: glycoside hydrolase family 31 protein [Chitinophagaceae bacterium]|nr:glycoside hydrolase family 31 protein [Chitinophagaceae bacterium]
MTKYFILLHLFVLLVANAGIAQQSDSSVRLPLLANEQWWGGAATFGNKMPMGKEKFSFNLYGDASQNQAVPLLISNKGRWLWSNEPFRYSFRNDSLVVDQAHSEIRTGTNGSSLREAYQYTSSHFFPSSGKWPDSLLVTAPQYNLWIELMYNPNQHDVLTYAQKVLANGFPAGVLMIDDNWSNYYGEFDFNKEKFPDAKKLMDTLHAKGFKTMLWICPFISPDSEVFRELLAKKLLLLDNEGNQTLSWNNAKKPLLIHWWNGYSACLDLTNPAAQQWLKDKLKTLQTKYGVDGFKLDAGDAYFYDNANLLSYKKASPNEHSEEWAKIGLAFPLNEFRAMWKMGGQPLVQRLADKDHSWGALQLLIPNSIAQQLAGYTFTCPDMIGGGQFTSFLPGNQIDQKLIVRSAQMHALMPMMQFSVAPWRILDSLHFAAVKKAVEIRQQYLPRLMQVMQVAAQTGEPALRPLEYNFPHRGFIEIKDQFMLGEDLMVAPIISKEDSRLVVVPKGKWRYQNQIIKGPVSKTFAVQLNEILVFEKMK